MSGFFFHTFRKMKLTLTRPLAVFDLETTGVKDRAGPHRADRHRDPIMPDGSRESYQTLVNPENADPPGGY
jgi:hypothetical protein